MTEQEWLECDNPQLMLDFIKGEASDRKLRLFAVQVIRRVAFLQEKECGSILDVAERHAEGKATHVELLHLRAIPNDDPRHVRGTPILFWSDAWYAAVAALAWATMGAFDRSVINARPDERPLQASFLREIFGFLFIRPIAIHPSWRLWNDATVPKIAQAINDERRFEDLPILADALEDAGCENDDILAHCRQPGEHVLGCWVVDLLLGKE